MNTLSEDIEDVLVEMEDADYWEDAIKKATKAINKLYLEFIKDLVGEPESIKAGLDKLNKSDFHIVFSMRQGRNQLRKELLELAENKLADSRGSDDN